MPRFASFVFPAAALCAFVSVSSPAARADVKVVSHVTITGAPNRGGAAQTPSDQTLTTYYKGTKTRTETQGNGGKGVVTIYDAQTNSLTVVNPAKKTYTVTSVQALTQNPMMAMLDIKTTATMNPGGKTKTVAGKPCKNYLWHATISMGVNQAAMPTPTGKNGAPPPKIPSGPLFSMKMDGEQWTTEAVKLPGAGGKSMLPAMMSGPARSIPGMEPLIKKLSAMKGLPLSSTVTQTFSQGEAMMGMPGGAGAGVPKGPMVTKTDVVSISEAPLPDALFAPPAGFRKVEDKRPGMPGGKMSGGGM